MLRGFFFWLWVFFSLSGPGFPEKSEIYLKKVDGGSPTEESSGLHGRGGRDYGSAPGFRRKNQRRPAKIFPEKSGKICQIFSRFFQKILGFLGQKIRVFRADPKRIGYRSKRQRGPKSGKNLEKNLAKIWGFSGKNLGFSREKSFENLKISRRAVFVRPKSGISRRRSPPLRTGAFRVENSPSKNSRFFSDFSESYGDFFWFHDADPVGFLLRQLSCPP